MIKQKLEDSFSIAELQIIDESELHRGHSGFQEGGESHFRIRLSSVNFANKSRLVRHRAVHAALGKDLLNQIHALALEIDVPK
tara:strand:+ start:73 stop:321 length:249 start_codon:yes stop_codon:yes gene_type:complete